MSQTSLPMARLSFWVTYPPPSPLLVLLLVNTSTHPNPRHSLFAPPFPHPHPPILQASMRFPMSPRWASPKDPNQHPSHTPCPRPPHQYPTSASRRRPPTLIIPHHLHLPPPSPFGNSVSPMLIATYPPLPDSLSLLWVVVLLPPHMVLVLCSAMQSCLVSPPPQPTLSSPPSTAQSLQGSALHCSLTAQPQVVLACFLFMITPSLALW